jgi:hypothetical protein
MAKELKTEKGQLKDVFSKQDKKGKTIYMTRLAEDGPVFCTYSNALAEKMEKLTEQHVEIDYTGDDFKKIEDVRLDEKAPAPEPEEGGPPQRLTGKDAQIARAVALKAAASYLGGIGSSKEKPAEQIIKLAGELVSWLTGEEAG